MVNVGRVVQQSVEYYVSQVAGNAEEYYSVRGEAQGQWIGKGAAELGLSKTVKAEEFKAVLSGHEPDSETSLSPTFSRRKVLGIDTVFRAPKSVSLMFAIGEGVVRSEVLAAHDAAVLAGMDYIERHAAVGREGKAGVNKVRGSGLISSAWMHRTSRAGDPLLHTHVVSANMIHTENDRWVTLDSKRIYRHAKTAGVLYQAELRRQLTNRLGVSWQPVKNGLADVAGVDRKVIDAFSKRSNQINSELEAIEAEGTKAESAKAAQVAALTTRAPKGAAEAENVFESWAQEAATHGFDASSVKALCDRTLRASAPAKYEYEYEPIAAELVSPRGVTAQRSTFDRRDVILALAERLPTTTPADTIEQVADRWIAEYALVMTRELGPDDIKGCIRHRGAGEAVLTTVDMVEIESRLVEGAISRTNAGVAVVPPHIAARLATSKSTESLNEDQRAMVNHILHSGSGVDVVIGDAGTGKTFALGVMREHYEAAGYRVLGAAIAHRAVHELSAGAGIESRSIASLRLAIERDGAQALLGGEGRGTVLVIDEASMVGTRDLERLHEAAAAAGAKLVLVGDDKQLASIEAGGAFTALANRLGAARLQTNMRQRDPIDRTVATAFAERRIGDAVALGLEHDRIRVLESGQDARFALVEDWAADPHRSNSLIVAATNAEIDQLNAMCQRKLLAAGDLVGEPTETKSASFYVGDRVVFRETHKLFGIVNGDFATVVEDGGRPGQMVVRIDRTGEDVRIGPRITDRPGAMRLGYASTVHVAQGATVDSSYTLFSESMTREHAYVAVTRGREKNVVYAPKSVLQEEAGFGEEIFENAEAWISRALTRSEAHELAIDVTGVKAAGGEDADGAAAARVSVLESSLVANPPTHIVVAIGVPPRDNEALDCWRRTAAQIEVYRVKWGLGDDAAAIGKEPDVAAQHREWRVIEIDKQRLIGTRRQVEVAEQLSRGRSHQL